MFMALILGVGHHPVTSAMYDIFKSVTQQGIQSRWVTLEIHDLKTQNLDKQAV